MALWLRYQEESYVLSAQPRRATKSPPSPTSMPHISPPPPQHPIELEIQAPSVEKFYDDHPQNWSWTAPSDSSHPNSRTSPSPSPSTNSMVLFPLGQ